MKTYPYREKFAQCSAEVLSEMLLTWVSVLYAPILFSGKPLWVLLSHRASTHRESKSQKNSRFGPLSMKAAAHGPLHSLAKVAGLLLARCSDSSFTLPVLLTILSEHVSHAWVYGSPGESGMAYLFSLNNRLPCRAGK